MQISVQSNTEKFSSLTCKIPLPTDRNRTGEAEQMFLITSICLSGPISPTFQGLFKVASFKWNIFFSERVLNKWDIEYLYYAPYIQLFRYLFILWCFTCDFTVFLGRAPDLRFYYFCKLWGLRVEFQVEIDLLLWLFLQT